MESDAVLSLLGEDVLEGAKALLGMHLVLGRLRARIVEVEAYRTPDDPACHAHRGPTRRNRVMYGPPGHAYVYFNYGVHWMLNVTAHRPGEAAAVLIRAAEPLDGLAAMYAQRPKAKRPEDLLSGPGKLAAAYGLSGADNGWFLFDKGEGLRLETPPTDASESIVASPRVGIRVGMEHPWRFTLAESRRWVSRPLPNDPLGGAPVA